MNSHSSAPSPVEKLQEVIAYIDGACSGNPGPGGWGVFLQHNNSTKEFFGWELETTNNRMELIAAIKCLELLKRKCKVIIYTDSIYVKNGIILWIHKWLQNNWRNSNKELVKNADLWHNLYKLSLQHDIDWHWVKGHSHNKGNIKADELARQGRDQAKKLLICP